MKGPDIVVSQVVAAPLETVWESWADFGGIYKFHEDVRKTTILTKATPRGVGAVRLCELVDGKNQIEERVVEWEPLRKLSVEFKRTSLPIAEARADFLFEALRLNQTRVEMRCSFTPRGFFVTPYEARYEAKNAVRI
ncbi:MAG: SRPBCC family protein [Rhodobacteraceae bacterium]|nr:SRPBCC family protein [Paracoccaceae bacterium]